MTVYDSQDYKYVMQDLEHYYIGSRLSYNELLESPLIPFKLGAIIRKYLIDGIDTSTSLESHFYYMDRESEAYRTLKHLKVKARCMIREEKKGGKALVYKEKILGMPELTKISPAEKEANEMIITEIIFGKLSLMIFQI